MPESISQKQNKYKRTNGKHFQVLRGGKKPKKNRKFEYVMDITSISKDVEIHVHEGKKGVGYTKYTYRTKAGVEQFKAAGFGVYGRTFNWKKSITPLVKAPVSVEPKRVTPSTITVGGHTIQVKTQI